MLSNNLIVFYETVELSYFCDYDNIFISYLNTNFNKPERIREDSFYLEFILASSLIQSALGEIQSSFCV